MIRTTALLAFPLLLFGCGKKEPEQAALGPDVKQFKGTGYTVAVPRSWKAIDLTTPDASKAIDELMKDPQWAPHAATFKTILGSKSIKLFAAMPEATVGNFVGNLNVIELPAVPGLGGDAYHKETEKQLSQMSGASVIAKKADIPGADVRRYDWVNPMGGQKLNTTSVIAIHRDQQVVFTFTLPDGTQAAAQPVVEKVIRSIRFE